MEGRRNPEFVMFDLLSHLTGWDLKGEYILRGPTDQVKVHGNAVGTCHKAALGPVRRCQKHDVTHFTKVSALKVFSGNVEKSRQPVRSAR